MTDGDEPGPPTTDAEVLGEPHAGQYHLGPVDFAETEWHNACAPGGSQYRSSLRDATGLGGEYLAGVSNQYAQTGGVCDACILIKTATGRSIVARVVTYGVEQEAGDIDVSPSVFDSIHSRRVPPHDDVGVRKVPRCRNAPLRIPNRRRTPTGRVSG